MSIESVVLSNHLNLCRPLLLLPSIFPSIRVFSNESALRIRWPKYLSFSFSINPSNEHPGLISFRMDWLVSLQCKGLSRVFSNTTVQKHQFFSAQSSLWSSSHTDNMTTGKTIALTRQTNHDGTGRRLNKKEDTFFTLLMVRGRVREPSRDQRWQLHGQGPQAWACCPPPSWGVSPGGTNRKPGGGQGTVVGSLVGLELGSGQCLEGVPGERRRAQAPAPALLAAASHPVWAMGGQHTAASSVQTQSPDPDCRQRGLAAFIHRCFPAVVCRKLRKGTQRRDDWPLCLSAKPRFVADSWGSRTLFGSVQEGTFLRGGQFLGMMIVGLASRSSEPWSIESLILRTMLLYNVPYATKVRGEFSVNRSTCKASLLRADTQRLWTDHRWGGAEGLSSPGADATRRSAPREAGKPDSPGAAV